MADYENNNVESDSIEMDHRIIMASLETTSPSMPRSRDLYLKARRRGSSKVPEERIYYRLGPKRGQFIGDEPVLIVTRRVPKELKIKHPRPMNAVQQYLMPMARLLPPGVSRRQYSDWIEAQQRRDNEAIEQAERLRQERIQFERELFNLDRATGA